VVAALGALAAGQVGSQRLPESEHVPYWFQKKADNTNANKKQAFVLGDRVKVRDTDTEEWKYGFVTDLSPLKVQPDYYDTSFPWEHVEWAPDHARDLPGAA